MRTTITIVSSLLICAFLGTAFAVTSKPPTAQLMLNNGEKGCMTVNLEQIDNNQKQELLSRLSTKSTKNGPNLPVINYRPASYSNQDINKDISPILVNGYSKFIEEMPILNQSAYGVCHDFATVEALDLLNAPNLEVSEMYAGVNEAEDTYNIDCFIGLEFSLDLDVYYSYYYKYGPNAYFNFNDSTPNIGNNPYAFCNNADITNYLNLPIMASDAGNEIFDFPIAEKYGLLKNYGLYDQNGCFYPTMPGANGAVIAIYNTDGDQPAFPAPTSNITKYQADTYINNYKNSALNTKPDFKINKQFMSLSSTNPWFSSGVSNMNKQVESFINEGNIVPITFTVFPNYPYYDAAEYNITHQNNNALGISNVGMIGKYYTDFNFNGYERNPNITAGLTVGSVKQDVWADSPALDFYAKTVLNNSKYSNDFGGHAVLIVGYINNAKVKLVNDEEKTETLYIILNSWGIFNGDYGFNFMTGDYLYNYGTTLLSVS